jgi:hypothetical protein
MILQGPYDSYYENARNDGEITLSNTNHICSDYCKIKRYKSRKVTDSQNHRTDITEEEIFAIHSDRKGCDWSISRILCKKRNAVSRVTVMETSTRSSESKRSVRCLNKSSEWISPRTLV